VSTPTNASQAGSRTVPLVTSTIIATQHAFDLAEHLRDEELKQKIYEVYTLVLVLDRQMAALEEENRNLRRELAERRRVMAERKGVFGYWFKEGETDPLCPVCCERDDAVSYLTQLERVSDGSRRTCPTCQSVFWEQRTSELPVIPGSTMCHVCGSLMLRLGRWYRCRGCGSARGIG
jgi:hypothetical protein